MKLSLAVAVSTFQFLIVSLITEHATAATHLPEEESYDFIIVGAGTAGCAVAGRLSENGKHTVLLLETGRDPDPQLYIPAVSYTFAPKAGFLKRINSIPQANAGLENNGVVTLYYGETLGGTSATNGMNFNRGSPHDYNQWASLTGDESWNYSNLLKYFKKLENYKGDFLSDQDGVGGPVTVSRPKYAPSLEAWLQSGRQLGYSVVDPNGPQKISFTPVEFTKKFGRRVTSYTAYIQPFIEFRRNLEVLTRAKVTIIIFSRNRAVGVQYNVSLSDGTVEQRSASAKKEIIVSAGAIGSPILLMKSGIGPKHVLDAAKIPVVKYLPVGENLQDHVAMRIAFALNNGSAVTDRKRDLTPENRWIYDQFGDGSYSSRNALVGQAFLASQTKSGNQTWADVHLSPEYSPDTVTPEHTQNMADWEVAMSTLVMVTRPKSIGAVTLNCTHVNEDPLIDFQYFAHPDDMKIMISGIQKTLKIFEETASHKRLGARFLPPPLPACRQLKFRSDEYWRCYIRQRAASGDHAVGTCKMGRGPVDPDAVVDTNLRVIGIERLRVVDASVMSKITNANTQALVYVIAQKAADMILQSWENVPKLVRFSVLRRISTV